MRTFARHYRSRRLALAILPGAGCLLAGGAAHAGPTAFALTEGNQLLRFDADAPSRITQTIDVTGLAVDDALAGISFRPATPGQLYAIGDSNRLYTINTSTGVATPVGSAPFADPDTLTGTISGFDFNPVADRIRVVTSDGENFRIHPDTGARAATDDSLAYASGDVSEEEAPDITAIAYTNSIAGASSTTLLGIDSALANLVEISPPNNGVLRTIGAVQDSDQQLFTGFDIVGPSNTAYAASTAVFLGSAVSDPASLFRINFSTGAATPVGAIGDGSETLLGLAVSDSNEPNPIPLPPAALAFPAVAVIGLLARRRMLRQAAGAN